jgi:anti-sigma regulatory factor (Ser/Thr protein kinase)
MTRSVDVTIQNEVKEIAAVRDALDHLGRELEVPAPALMQLQVALDEIVSNVIKYSWIDGGKHEVLVRINVNATSVSLDIFDDGQPFDPRLAPLPDRPPPSQRPRAGGVGIQMVKKLVDDLAYERTDGRNHTRLTKNCAVGGYSERNIG